MRIICVTAVVLGLAALVGCEQAPPATASKPAGMSAGGPPPPPPLQGDNAGAPPQGTAGSAHAGTDRSSGDAAARGYEREVVSVGADKRGRGYGGGMITEPIRQYFRVSQRLNLLNLKHAMNLYKASHNNKLPDTHEKFMKEIVKANSIELPQLPEGERYVFDPARGELMVQRPK